MDHPLEYRFRSQGEGGGIAFLLQPFDHVPVAFPVGARLEIDVCHEFFVGVPAEKAADGAGFDEGDVDTGILQLQAQGVGEPFQGELGAVVGAAVGHGGETENGAVLDDAPFSRPAHGRQHRAGEFVGAQQVGFELGAQGGPVEVLHRTGLAVGAIVEQGVEPATGPVQHLFHGPVYARRIVQVELERLLEALFPQLLDVSLFPGGGKYAVAALRKGVGDMMSDAAGAAGDENAAL